MVILLNLIVPLVLLVGCWLTWKKKKLWPIGAAGALVLLYTFVQPSYMPKGEVKRTNLPEFEYHKIEVEDRLSKPKSGQQYDDERNQAIKDGLPFNK